MQLVVASSPGPFPDSMSNNSVCNTEWKHTCTTLQSWEQAGKIWKSRNQACNNDQCAIITAVHTALVGRLTLFLRTLGWWRWEPCPWASRSRSTRSIPSSSWWCHPGEQRLSHPAHASNLHVTETGMHKYSKYYEIEDCHSFIIISKHKVKCEYASVWVQ